MKLPHFIKASDLKYLISVVVMEVDIKIVGILWQGERRSLIGQLVAVDSHIRHRSMDQQSNSKRKQRVYIFDILISLLITNIF